MGVVGGHSEERNTEFTQRMTEDSLSCKAGREGCLLRPYPQPDFEGHPPPTPTLASKRLEGWEPRCSALEARLV